MSEPTQPLPIADPPPPKDTTGTKFVIPYTYLGTRTTPPGAGSPDVLLLPGPPAGRLYFLQGILVTASIVEKYPWDQNSFLYDKVLNGSTWEAWTPNLDAVGKLEVPADFVGTRVGGGGYAETFPKPKDAVTWKDYALPIPQTPSIQVQVGSNLGAGNSLLIQETFLDGGPAEEIRFTNGSKVTSGFTDDAEPVPAGFEDLITTAFVKAAQKYSGGISSINGLDLANHPLTGKGSGPTQSTGGYGNDQCSGEQKGTYIVWTEYQKSVAGDHLIAEELLSTPGKAGYLAMAARQVA